MAEGRARRFGAFEALQLLVGKGGQGRLFAARCLEEGAFEGLHVGDEVVLKAMPVRADDPERAYRRLSRRTAALVAARHPGIVRYYGCFETEGGGIDDAMHVVVMELLRGETLEERLKREPLGLDGAESLAILRACLEALVHAASFGIVHRDIKPSNVFLCEDGGVKLIDFEVARQATSAQTTTESGAMQGTFDYMAPDFHPNFRPDPKFRGDQCSDVFSLAVTFHEMLAGRRPYAASQTLGDQSMMAFFQRWTRAEGVDPRRAIRVDGVRVHALRHLQRILRKALQPERSARYQTYAEFLAALSRVEPRVLEGERGRYRLSKCVGKGGFGVVYKAFRESDGAAVAIKVLLRAEYAERFDREGRVLMRFDDDRIVTFVEAFAGGDPMSPTHFLVMRYLEGMPGSSLKDRLAADPSRRGLPRAETLAAFVRFAEGLQILHDEGVYHRDIKPANLYFPAGAPERACLMDLGVVRTDETQTNGGLPGTLDYMAPELATGGSRGDASADLYALGLCLYEALTGRTAYPRLPRGSEGVAAFYARARSGEEPDLSGLDDEPELQALVRSMIAADRSERPASAREAARLLRSVPFREDEPREAVSADGVYSEDTTDDLVLPPVPPPPASSPSASSPSLSSSSSGSAPEVPSAPAGEEEGGETRALPAGGGETVAALGEGERAGGETAAFPPEGDEASEPEPVVAEAEGDAETAVAPEPEPAAAAEAEAETRAPGDGETVAAAEAGDETVAGEPGETSAAADETAASPTAVAAEGLTATAVAETVAPEGGTTTAAVEGLTATAATMAAESGTTTAVAEGFTATAATMAAEGETAATAAVDETSATAATAAFEPAEPARPARRSGRSPDRSAKAGVREVRPASRWRSFAAAACVLLLCGAAAGVYFFQDWLHKILAPEPAPTPVAGPAALPGADLPPTTTYPTDLLPADDPTHTEEISSSNVDELRGDIETFRDSIRTCSGNNAKAITDIQQERERIENVIAEKSIGEALKTEWTEAESAAKALWETHLGPEVGQLTNENSHLTDLDYWNEYTNQATELKGRIARYVGEDSKLFTDIDNWLETIAADKKNLEEKNQALNDANKFATRASNAKSQDERKQLISEPSGRMETAKKWPDVQEKYDEATNRLQKAIAAYETVDEVVKSAKKANEFDALVEAYGKLVAAKSTPDIPADAETMRTNALYEVGKKLDENYAAFDKNCGTEQDKAAYDKHVDEAKQRQEKASASFPDLAAKYGATHSRITGGVELTIRNDSGVPLFVTVGNNPRKDLGESFSISIPRWSDLTVSAVAQEHPEDYDPWSEDISIKNQDVTKSIKLEQKPAPTLSVTLTSNILEVSLNGKTPWYPIPHTFKDLNPREDYSVHWRIGSKHHPEDYVQTNGVKKTKTHNRGDPDEISINGPALKPAPVVSFKNNGPDIRLKIKAKDGTPGANIVVEKEGKTSLSRPRDEWDVEATFANAEDGKEWFPVNLESFRTGNRGTTTDIVITQRRRPEIRVTNASLAAFEIDGKPVDPGEEVSLFGEGENTNRFYNISLLNVTNSFYKNEGKTLLSFGAANSTTNFEIYLEIDGEKMKVEEGDPRFDDHSCFVNWTNQLERLKDDLRKDYREELRAFLGSCEKWMETQREAYDPVKDEKTAKALHLSLFVAQCRCLVLEWKIAEVLDDTDKRTEIEGEIRKLANLNKSTKLTRGFDEDTKTDSEKLERGSYKDTKTVWDEMVKRWPALQD